MTGQRSPENAEGLPTKEELCARIKQNVAMEAKAWEDYGHILLGYAVAAKAIWGDKPPRDGALDVFVSMVRKEQASPAQVMEKTRVATEGDLRRLLDDYGMAGVLDLLSQEFKLDWQELGREVMEGPRWVGEEPLSTVSLDGWLGTMVMRHSLHGKGKALDTYTSPTGEVRYFDWKKIRESYRKKQPGLSALFLKERLVEQKDHAVEKIGEQLRDIQTYPARGDTEGVYALYYASEYLSRRRLLQELSTRHSEVEGGS